MIVDIAVIVFLLWTLSGYFWLLSSYYPTTYLPEYWYAVWGLNPFVQIMREMLKRM